MYNRKGTGTSGNNLASKRTLESETTMIHVRTLKNDNPSFEENNTLSIALNDGGLSEILILKEI